MAPAKVGEFYMDKSKLIAEVIEITEEKITFKLVLPPSWASDQKWTIQSFYLAEWEKAGLIKVNNISAAKALYGFKV